MSIIIKQPYMNISSITSKHEAKIKWEQTKIMIKSQWSKPLFNSNPSLTGIHYTQICPQQCWLFRNLFKVLKLFFCFNVIWVLQKYSKLCWSWWREVWEPPPPGTIKRVGALRSESHVAGHNRETLDVHIQLMLPLYF